MKSISETIERVAVVCAGVSRLEATEQDTSVGKTSGFSGTSGPDRWGRTEKERSSDPASGIVLAEPGL